MVPDCTILSGYGAMQALVSENAALTRMVEMLQAEVD